MTLVEMMVFLLSASGMAVILADSKLFDFVRPKYYFFRCSMCMGFWTGFFVWAVNSATGLFTFDNSLLTGVLLGCMTSVSAWVLSGLGAKLED